MPPNIQPVALHEATRRRYLSYALSVITSRALPDVRDGLKPVQRRILYAMHHSLRLRPEGRFRKSAAVVGDVMAKFHPHGDQSIYDAMVRMAQPFSLLHPLVNGQGNFGSMDGDGAAAMRYTEAKLQPLAMELLEELGKQTVGYRPNYDGQTTEPIVLPARFPQLLVNGAEGIAVGMATKIPPHNLGEVISAAVRMIDKPDSTVAELCRYVKGPDFPTGGEILTSPADLVALYETGSGKVVIRGTHTTEKVGRKHYIIITSVPYSQNKATLVERIGGLVADKKLPQLTDVRDESTDVVRVVLELRREEDAGPAMAYLYKHTPLQQNFHVNMTCLVPTPGNPDVASPARLDLASVLREWLDFRLETVRRRFQYELRKLLERIHILEGFEIIFDELDEAVRIIRASEGKRDSAEKLMDRFDLDDIQTEAILELRLYKLARLEILSIRTELAEKRAEAARIQAILSSEDELWAVVRTELQDVKRQFKQRRRTSVIEAVPEKVYDESAYIVSEDAFVVVTREGWIKRQGRFSEVDKIRVREGDSVGWLTLANTKSTVTFFTSLGSAYTLRVVDVPATTGYGEPVQAHFKFKDGERIVGVASHDKRSRPKLESDQLELGVDVPPPHAVCVTREGRGLRAALVNYQDPSTKSGRKFCKVSGSDSVIAAYASNATEWASIATHKGRMLVYPISELNTVRSAGKGVTAIKLNPGDTVLAFELTVDKFGGATVVTSQGREETARASKHMGKRADKGSVILRRGHFAEWVRVPDMQMGDQEESK
jgi:DNA gyrase subunit A